ncbi:MAG: hypothetical protein KDL87_17195, partial [Verrucomicrobiae bacterium]|nr:hypothetical protein [Verrucomicrobiae bacterium]
LVAGSSSSENLSGIAETLYLAILSRFPTAEEITTLKAHAEASSSSGKALAEDLAWALINQPEFFHNH